MSESNSELLRLAGLAHAAGKLAEAESLAQQVLATEPANIQAHLLMGVLAGKTGRADLAFSHLKTVLAANPESFEALFWMSVLHRRNKNLGAATEFAERAAKVRPGDAHSYNALGLCYLDQLRLEEAAQAFQKALSIKPDQSPVLHNLGTALYLLGREMDAAKAFDRALILAPNSVESFLSLGQVLLSQTNSKDAAKCAQRALALNPRSAEGHLLLASALVEDSRAPEAEKHMQEAIAINPQDAQAYGLLGQRLQALGKFAEANAYLEKSLELQPRQGFAYFAYVHNNKLTEKDRPLVDTMERLVAEGGLDPRQTSFLRYGLGRSLESLGDYEQALQHFDEANRVARKLKFGDAVFDGAAYSAYFDWLIESFSREFVESQSRKGGPSDLPVVIVGMMRSGTTLVEQILSSHPKIGAAGEQKFWTFKHEEMFGQGKRTLNAKCFPQLGAQYTQILKRIAPGFGHVTDKNPGNYELLGPIHISLPNARIIHMRRNPLDTCISIYTTPNRVKVDFAHDRDNIVFAYEQYLRLMEHWRSVLPSDRFLEVNYEDVVADRETQARRMLGLIGLDWDDALLHHEKNERSVITPSLWQVRQPIYTSSVERWRRYEPWLGPFKKLLVENLLKQPPQQS